MSTCGTCRFFGERAINEFGDPCGGTDERMEDQPARYHVCTLIRHASKYRELKGWADVQPTEAALVVDGSGYFGALCVSEEFGCNQWQQRKPVTDSNC